VPGEQKIGIFSDFFCDRKIAKLASPNGEAAGADRHKNHRTAGDFFEFASEFKIRPT
jgi:hypothetical protein